MLEQHDQRDNGKKVNEKHLGSLDCDPETGVCLVSGSAVNQCEESAEVQVGPLIEIEYFTDPYCSWCWATEPSLYRLRETYRDSLRIRYVMGGLVRDMSDFYDGLNDIRTATQVAPHWCEVSQRSRQPIDERLWEDITDPHFSTWPACIAVKGAQFQGESFGEQFLRRIRRAALTERRIVSDLKVQQELVLDVPNLDAARWLEDMESGRAADAFREDLSECRRHGVSGFPTMLFRTLAEGAVLGVERPVLVGGYRSFVTYEQVMRRLAPVLQEHAHRGLLELPSYYGPMTTRELSEIHRRGPDEIRQEMRTLASQGRARECRVRGGELWESVPTR